MEEFEMPFVICMALKGQYTSMITIEHINKQSDHSYDDQT